jgi:hypothetical protein
MVQKTCWPRALGGRLRRHAPLPELAKIYGKPFVKAAPPSIGIKLQFGAAWP